MSESLWSLSARELLDRTASSSPTPGGGSVAAVTGALGVALVEMAVAVTADAALEAVAAGLEPLRQRVAAAADADVEVFTALVTAHRLPHEDDDDRRRRQDAVEESTVRATEGPLALVAALLDALDVSRGVEPLVKADVVSDVLAGRDLLTGAARAAVRTADTNIEALRRSSSSRAVELQDRRDGLVRRLQEAA